MNQKTPINLNEIQVAAPCLADWEGMKGDDRTRFCMQCRKNVYNLSDMSRAEAEAFVREREGRVCVRFFRRADGTLLTDNCPVGLRLVRKSYRWVAWAMTASITLVCSSVVGAWNYNRPVPRPPVPADCESPVMGKIAMPVMGEMNVPPPPRQVTVVTPPPKFVTTKKTSINIGPPPAPPVTPPPAPNFDAPLQVEEF